MKTKHLLVVVVLSIIFFTQIALTPVSCGHPEPSLYPQYYYLKSSFPVSKIIPPSINKTTYRFQLEPETALSKNQLLLLEIKTNQSTWIRLTSSTYGLIADSPITPLKTLIAPVTNWVKTNTIVEVFVSVERQRQPVEVEIVIKIFQLIVSDKPKENIELMPFFEGRKESLTVVGLLLPSLEVNASKILKVSISPIPYNVSYDNEELQKAPDGSIRIVLQTLPLFIEISVNGSINWVSAYLRLFFYNETESDNSPNVMMGILSVVLFLAPLAVRHKSLSNTRKRASKYANKGD